MTDGQTDRHTTMGYASQSIARAVKMRWFVVIRSHQRSSALSPLVRAYMIFCSSSIETVPVWYRFRDTASYLSNYINFDLLHLHLVPQLGVTTFRVLKRFLASKTYSLWAVIRRCLRHPRFSRFSRTPTCDGHTDRQTQGNGLYREEHSSRGKIMHSYLLWDTFSTWDYLI